MAEEKSSGQWAAEAFDFLRLFRRVSRSFSGLLLVEIGWAALLFLVAKLSAAGATPVVGIPWVAPGGGAVVWDVPLTTIFTFGAAAIAFVWFLTSGLHLYLSAPIATAIRVVGAPLVILLVISLGIAGLPILLLSWPVESYLFARWKKRKDPAKLEQAMKKNREAILEAARKEMSFRADWFQSWMMGRGVGLAQTWASAGFIGLGPLYSYSYDEDLLGAKAPVQIFAEAIGRMRLKLWHLRGVQHVSFRVLPPLLRAADHRTARRLRRWLGLDALLWGSYVSTDPPMIWLNVDQALTRTDKEQQEKGDDSRNWSEGDPFPASVDEDHAAFIVDQRDSQDAYIVLLLALVQALKRRQAEKLRLYPRWVDRLYYTHRDVKIIISHLVRDALFALESPLTASPASRPTPTAKEALVDLAGKWISVTVDRDLFDRDSREGLDLLWEVARKCADLLPDDAGANYRFALLSTLVGKDDEAASALATALKRDTNARWTGDIRLRVQADMAIDMVDLRGGQENVKLAKAGIYAARAVAFADDKERSKKDLREKLIETTYYRAWKLEKEPLSRYETLLHRSLDLSP